MWPTGRVDPTFHDDNEALIDQVIARFPAARSMEMETYLLFHLANCCRVRTKAASAAIVVCPFINVCGILSYRT